MLSMKQTLKEKKLSDVLLLQPIKVKDINTWLLYFIMSKPNYKVKHIFEITFLFTLSFVKLFLCSQ